MSDPLQAAPPAATITTTTSTAVQAPGFFERAVEHVFPHAGHAELPGIAAAIHAHAADVFSVAGDLLPLLAAVDPANAAAVGVAEGLLPKVLGMINGATMLVAAAHRPPATG